MAHPDNELSQKRMDLDIEKIHSILVEANLPSSINDLKNPTEEFVVNLISTFLRRFHINVGFIDKPCVEQQDLMWCYEDSDIIGLINLHVAMVQICDRIFLKDLCITDITSPGAKRIRKQAKFLANFMLYAINKESDIQDRVDDIQSRAQMLHDTSEKKNKVQEAINDNAVHIGKQLSLKEKLKDEIKNIQLRIENDKKKDSEVVAKMTVAAERKQKVVEICGSYKTETVKLSNAIERLQSEVVKSPEEHKTRLRELEEQDKLKKEERKMMQEAFEDKKQLIKKNESILAFTQKQFDTFSEVKDLFKQSKKLNVQADNVKKQVQACSKQLQIAGSENKLKKLQLASEENKSNELLTQREERLSQLRKLHSELLSKKNLETEKLKEQQVHYNESCLKLNKMQDAIKKVEEEISIFTQDCQKLYDNEIRTETKLMEVWNGGSKAR